MLRTTNYGLCQYEGSDKTSYLVNYNNDMLKIDTAIKDASDSATSAQNKADTADGKADANASSINTLNTQINGVSGIATDVATLQGSVNTINSLIGNGEPTTTDKTLIGAINEINAEVTDIPQIELDISDLKGSVLSITGQIGDLTDLDTTVKTDVVSAINEIVSSGAGEGTVGTAVDLASHTTEQTGYTTETDGYIFLFNWGGNTSYVATPFQANFLYLSTTNSAAISCYVKKGTKVWASLGANSQAKFYPYQYA